jgi:hypothetical protein
MSLAVVSAVVLLPLSAQPAGAANVAFECTSGVWFNATPTQLFGTTLWTWSMNGSGRCRRPGEATTVWQMRVTGHSLSGCGEYGVTSSPRQPWHRFSVTTELTNTVTGQYRVLRQIWYPTVDDTLALSNALPRPIVVELHRYTPVPSRYVAIGGVTGGGAGTIAHPIGPWEYRQSHADLTLHMQTQELPGTTGEQLTVC